MTIYGTIIPGARSAALGAWKTENLTEEAKHRIKVLDWHKAHGSNVSLTARHFGLNRETVGIWAGRLRKGGPVALNERSRKPKRTRVPVIPSSVVLQVCRIRRQYPAWSKYKIGTLVRKDGPEVSDSTVGRILRRRGLIEKKASIRRKRAALKPKRRFPRGLVVREPGQLVQMDTKYISLPEGRKHWQFTAIDVLSKIRVLRVCPSESSRNGALFLRECMAALPFRIQAVQTDNGAPFLKEFEKLCGEMGIPHYFGYPRTPKNQSYVESSHSADEREFYQQGNVCIFLGTMRSRIMEWENTWNTVRPHASLNYLTPQEYLARFQIKGRIPTKDTIILQA